MKSVLLVLFALTIAFSCTFASDLPRKRPRESYPNVDVIYDSVTTPRGERLRTIVTKPRELKGKLPVVFVAGWLSRHALSTARTVARVLPFPRR